MAIRRFKYSSDWKKAVAAANLDSFLPPSQHEGMHEDDCYATVFAISKDVRPQEAPEFGMFNYDPAFLVGDGAGVLCDTAEEFQRYCNEGDPEVDSDEAKFANSFWDPMGNWHGRNY